MTNTTPSLLTKPEWLVPGAIVRVQFWVGQIDEVAVSDKRIMVLVSSAKGIWRNHPAEWLEFKPEHIRLATAQEIATDLAHHRAYITKMQADLESLGQKWLNKTEFMALER